MKKKVFAMFLAVAMLVSILVVPAFAVWPFEATPSTDEIRGYASHDLSADEIASIRSQYSYTALNDAIHNTIKEDIVSIAQMKENRPSFDDAMFPDIYVKYLRVFEEVYPDYVSGDNCAGDVYRKSVRWSEIYHNTVIKGFGVTRAKQSDFSSTDYDFVVDAVGAVGPENTMYICHFIKYNDGATFLLNRENKYPMTVGKTYSDYIAFIKIGTSQSDMENIGYMETDNVSKQDLNNFIYDAWNSFRVYHDLAFTIFHTYGYPNLTSEEIEWVNT